MSTLRSRVGVAVVENKLYAFGGYDGTSRLSTVECYDPQVNKCSLVLWYYHPIIYSCLLDLLLDSQFFQLDEWELKTPMSTKRSALSIAVLENNIYVIGGYDGNNSLSTMERCVPVIEYTDRNVLLILCVAYNVACSHLKT